MRLHYMKIYHKKSALASRCVAAWYNKLTNRNLEDENEQHEENKRRTDVETIYTSTDKKEVQELLDKYEVNYIFIGSCEYQKYEGVNVALLSSLGEIVFKKENTMIVKL